MIKLIKLLIKLALCAALAFALTAAVKAAPPSRVLITDYSVRGGGLMAGEVSTAVFTLTNMSSETAVNSVLITGWIEAAAPVEFTRTNQVYVARIPPGGEATVVFEYYTRHVDMTAIGTVSVGFSIAYSEEEGGTERSNNVSLRLPVQRGARTTVRDDDMEWPMPWVSDFDRLLASRAMQMVYVGGAAFSGVLTVIIMLFKTGILRRKF